MQSIKSTSMGVSCRTAAVAWDAMWLIASPNAWLHVTYRRNIGDVADVSHARAVRAKQEPIAYVVTTMHHSDGLDVQAARIDLQRRLLRQVVAACSMKDVLTIPPEAWIRHQICGTQAWPHTCGGEVGI